MMPTNNLQSQHPEGRAPRLAESESLAKMRSHLQMEELDESVLNYAIHLLDAEGSEADAATRAERDLPMLQPLQESQERPAADLESHVAERTRQLESTVAELHRKNEEVEAFVYIVSHDLRSPLVNVQGFGRQLTRACETIRQAVAGARDGQVPATALQAPVEVALPQALRFINAGVNKMDSLLNGLLQYSRLGRVTLTIRPLDMNALLAEIVAAMRFQLNEARAEVYVEALPAGLGDSAHTSQVFANLLDNALKYRAPDRPLRVAISGRLEGGQAVYTVADNGIGIAPEHQAKVFEIFHRLNPDIAGGEGLGLTIAQRVLERQKGRIWVESAVERGSTFHVSLPAA